MGDGAGRLRMTLVGIGLLLAIGACRAPVPQPRLDIRPGEPIEEAAARGHDTRLESEARLDESSPATVRLPLPEDDDQRWLWVEAVRDNADGGWATGSFDAKRNKLSIRTRDVQRFAIDVSRIRIDWERLVVIGIDGANSELRKRDFVVLHFARDGHGQWVVDE